MADAYFELLNASMTQDIALDGKKANLVCLSNASGFSVVLMDIGASWLSCRVPLNREKREVLLGVATLQDFYKQTSYLGATVGRYANRIANGCFNLDGKTYQLHVNQAGNCLHGGIEGFDKRRWTITARDAYSVSFTLQSPDGDQGFPGNVVVTVRYILTNDNHIIVDYLAHTDAATPINLTNHAYFNLLGADSGETCLSHRLEVKSDDYLPINEYGIPLGQLASVNNTGFDFRKPKVINSHFMLDKQQQIVNGYDHSFWLQAARLNSDYAISITSPDEAITMKIFTTKPAVQFYTGNGLGGVFNRDGGRYENYAGMAFEPQFLPDSPNHPEWEQESCILRPNQRYKHRNCYQFEIHNIGSI
ncbi:galactose-1-epimerase [Photorhabdus luminescens]|uniref:Aldose 1-epimerase n=1 Tax=Photorhabdus akhurstii TaxID=171438 RepID=A0ABX8LQ77_9GAMM|nr:galactose-1-epimerase [Photorhabdus akhurstii]QXF32308.1 galactose-1-epimerase [Photorhabdus akhurstii]UJD74101.1 galactose-1-epimerase [Photorhabdus luminescens]